MFLSDCVCMEYIRYILRGFWMLVFSWRKLSIWNLQSVWCAEVIVLRNYCGGMPKISDLIHRLKMLRSCPLIATFSEGEKQRYWNLPK